jgi:hypothetical protein
MAVSDLSIYQDKQVAFLTQHGKQILLQNRIENALGCQLVHSDAYDTDQLGTFTGEVVRQGSQYDAAKSKAMIGMRLTGLSIGMGSEGAFGPDPFVGFTSWNSEVVLWVDQALGIEVQGFAQGPAINFQRSIKTLDELKHFVVEADFPTHALNVRPDESASLGVHKGLRDIKALIQAFQSARAQSLNGAVVIENDLRAFSNPTRQALIQNATDDLIRKLLCACPQCAMPGFSLKKKKLGLPCRLCARATQLAVGEIWCCRSCSYESLKSVNQGELADPSRCDYCNP